MSNLLAGAPHLLVGRVFLIAVCSLVAVVLFKALRAALGPRGLLASIAGAPPEPERVAMLTTTLAAMATYSYQCLSEMAVGATALPPPPDWIVWTAVGGQATYLIGKAARLHQEVFHGS